VVTADGGRLLTRFPADQLDVAGTRYVTGVDLAASSGNGTAAPAVVRQRI
jgi:hypothetical protein